MSWILVIPFDVIKTIMQAESDPAKHRRMTKLFKSKTNVLILILFSVKISELLVINFFPDFS